jgi:hypothetical protein
MICVARSLANYGGPPMSLLAARRRFSWVAFPGLVGRLAVAAGLVAAVGGCSASFLSGDEVAPLRSGPATKLENALSGKGRDLGSAPRTSSADTSTSDMWPPSEVRTELALIAAAAAADGRVMPAWHVTYAVITSGTPRVNPEEVAAVAARAYRDPRGWSLAGAIRFERVPAPEEADFTLVVAEADTIPNFSEACVNGLTGEPDASCTTGNYVIINDVRWTDGALGDPYPLDTFRMQEINHETGHWLGQDHYTCGAAGEPAPVNQQQFRHLAGCLPNEWPLPWEQALVAFRHGLWSAPPGTDVADLLSRATPE